MHDAYTIGIPVLVILLANLINRSDLKDLKSELNGKLDKMQSELKARLDKLESDTNARFDKLESDTNARFDKLESDTNARFDKLQVENAARFDKIDRRFDLIDAELRYFHGITGKLDGRISAIEKR